MIVWTGRVVVNSTWPALVGPGSAFAFPLVLGPHNTPIASSIQVPMPFAHSMRVISEFNPHYFHVVYRAFVRASTRDRPRGPLVKDPPDVLRTLRDAGTADTEPRPAVSRTSNHGFVSSRGTTRSWRT